MRHVRRRTELPPRTLGIALAAIVAASLLALAMAAALASTGWAVAGALVAAAGVAGLLRLLGLALAQREALQSGIEAETRRYQEILDALQIGLVLYDRDDRIVLTNKDFRELYKGLEAHLRPGVTFEQLLRQVIGSGAMPEVQGDPEAWIAQRLQEHRHPQQLIVRRLANGRWRRITEQRLADGSLLAHSVDVTELLDREAQLRRLNADLDALNVELARQSNTDALTGLANRRQFDHVLAVEWSRAVRHGTPLSLLMLDVDHFKRFNDRHGHPAGDACLRSIATLLRGTAGRPTDLVARVGGEEFAILLPHVERSEAQALAGRCIDVVAQAGIVHGDSPIGPFVTLSVGIADLHSVGEQAGPSALIDAADTALYSAKRAGRFRFAMAPSHRADDLGPPRA